MRLCNAAILLLFAAVPALAQPSVTGESIDSIIAHQTEPAAADGYRTLFAGVTAIEQLDAIRDQLLPNITDRSLARLVTTTLARVYRTARRLDEAARLFAQAYNVSNQTDLASLFAHAQILFEQGDFTGADAEAARVVLDTDDYVLKRRAYTLSARAAFELGESERALQMLGTLASLPDAGGDAEDLVEVETFVLLREVLRSTGDSGRAQEVQHLLEITFPDSIESLRSSRARSVAGAGLPSSLLLAGTEEPWDDGVAPPTSSPGAVPATRRAPPTLTAIQVGSFSDADNAEHLAKELRNLGLTVRNDAISREGRTLHQVVVDIPGGSNEAAARVFATLRANNYDGFLVY